MKFISSVFASLILASSSFAAEKVKNVVFVHGAFADGSSYSKVISLLQKQGINAYSVQNPLSSLADDVAATDRTLNTITGPALLVGHSWGGTVISEAGDHEKVAGLVYIAALVPEKGKSTNEVMKGYPKSPGLSALKPDAASGYAWLTEENFCKNFAQDVTAIEQKAMSAYQGPVAMKAFDDKLTVSAYADKPSWFIVTENDRMVGTDLQRAEAKRIGATVTTLKASHVPMVSKPEEVAAVITAALGRLNNENAAPAMQAEESVDD